MRAWLPVILSFGLSQAGFAAEPASAPDRCEGAITAAETQFNLPAKLLASIALVESGRPEPGTGRIRPWPWSINVNGASLFYASKTEAVAAVQALKTSGIRSIDVGCLQINLMYHPDAFASLDEAFDPRTNAVYGARFLDALHHQIGSWPLAAAAYHSQTPDIGQGYEQRVMALWPLAAKYPDATLGTPGSPADTFDYSRYTPQFAAALKELHAEHARLLARYKPAIHDNGPSPYTPEFAARMRQTELEVRRLRQTSGAGQAAPPTLLLAGDPPRRPTR